MGLFFCRHFVNNRIQTRRKSFAHTSISWTVIISCFNITVFQETVKIICRLTRILHSPHECGHAMIISNGFPGLPLPIVKVSAYICGFNLFQVQPSHFVLEEKYTIHHFKSDIINAYTTAGLRVL